MRRWYVGAVSTVVVVLTVSACTSGGTDPGASRGSTGSTTTSGTTAPSPAGASTSSSAVADPAVLTITPALNAANVSPVAPVKVAVTAGTLSTVAMTNGEGTKVAGTLSADKTSWVISEALGYSKTYTITATAVNTAGKAVSKSSTFTTLTPDNKTMPYFTTTGGSSLIDGATYGVGMVVNVHFDEEITDKAAAEKALIVKTTPYVSGSWYWLDDQNVHWRPMYYYKTGTTVSVTAKVYGVQVGQGLYGQADKTTTFKIGASHISVADDNTKQVTVYENGKYVRTMATSMGKGGSTNINGHYITYWTQAGIMTVLDKANPVLMDSETYGLPHAAGGYKENVYLAVRITTDGVYLHSAPWSVDAQGYSDTSHGCLNLSPANAQWFYDWAVPGDVVQVKNTGGSPLTVGQNGDWGMPWAQWLKGSALH